jgi:putative peptidoglycan lipid II flippase
MQAITRWFRKQSGWLESQQASILSAAFIIFTANIASSIFGLIKNRVISAYYVSGGDNLVEAYWVAFRLPDFAYQLIILGTISAAFLPLFTKTYQKDKAEAYNLARQIMLILLGLFTLGSLIIFLFTPEFIDMLTGSEFTPSQRELAINMTRIMLIAQFFFAISGFFSAMLQSFKRFIMPAFSPIFYNIGIILFIIFFSSQLGLYAAAWGTVCGAFLHMIIQLPLIRKCGFHFIDRISWSKEKLKEILILAGPRTVTLAVEQLSTFTITFFATAIGGLSLTLITFAQSLMTLPIRFFGVSIGQAALPFLAASQDDITGFRRMVFRSLRQIVFFAAPSAVMLLVLRVALVRLAYGVGEFPWRATLMTAEALGILSLSIPAQAFTHLLVRAFYALNNTTIPFFSSTLYFLSTILFGWYFVLYLDGGVSGLALSLTLASVLETIVLFTLLLRRMGWESIPSLVSSLLRIGVAAFLMAITLFTLQRLFDLYVFETSRVWELIKLTLVVGAAGSSVYIGFCWLLRIEELTILKQIHHKLVSQWSKTVRSTPDFVESVTQPEQFEL